MFGKKQSNGTGPNGPLLTIVDEHARPLLRDLNRAAKRLA